MNIIFIVNLMILMNCQNKINISEKSYLNKSNNNKYYPPNLNSSNFINKKKNVILGIITKYSLKTIMPYFKSYLRANFTNCDIIMFVREVSKNVTNYLKSIGVIVYKIPEIYNRFDTIKLRWKMYIDFLEENIYKYNLVLHTDVRDTIFQRDLFECYENHEPFLGVAIEDFTLNQFLNKAWIIGYVGKAIHNIIQHERIICAGTLWGTSDKFLEFSKILWDRIIKNRHAVDQGVANFMFHYKKIFKDCLIKSDNFGPVMTIGLTKRSNIILDSKDNILNFEGEIAYIIHQYDRKKDITIKIYKKYCPELLPPVLKNNNTVNITDLNINHNIINKDNNIISGLNIFKEKTAKYQNIIQFFILMEFFTFIFLLKSKISLFKINKKIC